MFTKKFFGIVSLFVLLTGCTTYHAGVRVPGVQFGTSEGVQIINHTDGVVAKIQVNGRNALASVMQDDGKYALVDPVVGPGENITLDPGCVFSGERMYIRAVVYDRNGIMIGDVIREYHYAPYGSGYRRTPRPFIIERNDIRVLQPAPPSLAERRQAELDRRYEEENRRAEQKRDRDRDRNDRYNQDRRGR